MRLRASFAAIAPGRLAVVAGGASGIGLAVARALAAGGMRIAIVDRPGDALSSGWRPATSTSCVPITRRRASRSAGGSPGPQGTLPITARHCRAGIRSGRTHSHDTCRTDPAGLPRRSTAGSLVETRRSAMTSEANRGGDAVLEEDLAWWTNGYDVEQMRHGSNHAVETRSHRRSEMARYVKSLAAGIACAALALPLVSAAPLPVVRAGAWQVRSTVAALDVPGVPGVLQRMAKGRETLERKCVAADGTVAALLLPDPKAQCRVDHAEVGDGRYAQTLTCPQKRGGPITVTRTGTYDENGFVGRATASGTTPRGPMSVTLDQRAVRTADKCKA